MESKKTKQMSKENRNRVIDRTNRWLPEGRGSGREEVGERVRGTNLHLQNK